MFKMALRLILNVVLISSILFTPSLHSSLYAEKADPSSCAKMLKIICRGTVLGTLLGLSGYFAFSAGAFDASPQKIFHQKLQDSGLMSASPIKIEHIGQIHAPPGGESDYIENSLYKNEVPKIWKSQREIFFSLLEEKRPVFGEGVYEYDFLQSDREFLNQNLRPEDYTNESRLNELDAELGKPKLAYIYAFVKAAFREQKYFDGFFTPAQQEVLLELPAYLVVWAIGGIPDVYKVESQETNDRGFSMATSITKKSIILPHEVHERWLLVHRDRDIYALLEIARRAQANPEKFSDVIIVFGSNHDFRQYITDENIHVTKK